MRRFNEKELLVAALALAMSFLTFRMGDSADCKRQCGEFTEWRVCLKVSGLACDEFAIYWRGKDSKATFAYLSACCDPNFGECQDKPSRTKVQGNVTVKLCATCDLWCAPGFGTCAPPITQTINNAGMCDNDETMDRYKCYDPYE